MQFPGRGLVRVAGAIGTNLGALGVLIERSEGT